MYKLVYTSNPDMEHHLGEEVDVHIRENIVAINKDAKAMVSSRIVDLTELLDAGIIVKTRNSVYIYAYINNIQVCEYTGIGFY